MALAPPLSKAAASFVVRKRPMLEMLDTAMNEELLKQMAGMTGGKYYRLADCRKAEGRIPEGRKKLEAQRRNGAGAGKQAGEMTVDSWER